MREFRRGLCASTTPAARDQDPETRDPAHGEHRRVSRCHALRAHAVREYATVRRLPAAGHFRAQLSGVTFLAAAAWILAGCGGERSFDAEEFVSELNEHGAGLELGEPLSSQGPAAHEIHAVELASSATQVHGGGSLAVTGDVAEAEAEYERCESAASLICYRAANVVLRLEEASPEQQAQLGAALRALDDG